MGLNDDEQPDPKSNQRTFIRVFSSNMSLGRRITMAEYTDGNGIVFAHIYDLQTARRISRAFKAPLVDPSNLIPNWT